jgi:AraC family transcriptional regulator of arabinose operon
MLQAYRQSNRLRIELALNALEEVILRAHAAQDGDLHATLDSRIVRAVSHLTEHFREPFHLPALARRCGLSVSRFSHLFRSQLGQTPGQFLERQRLAHAVDLLRRTPLGVAEIADACGFEDPFYFTNRFRRHYGKSPSRFRLAAQQESLKPR